ncbi:hypothetical protein SEA_MORGANA_50 [Gordonia phage Morgana]|uniref:Minor tail protein n=1 Tax=Gordonia phage Morgana TaxID=3137292 RepID=A0AAX4RBB8_9CAUD
MASHLLSAIGVPVDVARAIGHLQVEAEADPRPVASVYVEHQIDDGSWQRYESEREPTGDWGVVHRVPMGVVL